MDGGAQESGMRAGTENVASIVGLATALKKNCHEMKQNQENLLQIEQKFLNVLANSNLDFVRNGDVNHIPGNVSISFVIHPAKCCSIDWIGWGSVFQLGQPATASVSRPRTF